MPGIKISPRAFASMMSEVEKYPLVETGGVLLGAEIDGVIYIAEAIGPGVKAVRTTGNLSCDMESIAYIVQSLSGVYDRDIDIIGVWHKHNHSCNPPFSDTDMDLHREICAYSDSDIASILFQREENGNEYTLRAFRYLSADKVEEEDFEVADMSSLLSYRIW